MTAHRFWIIASCVKKLYGQFVRCIAKSAADLLPFQIIPFRPILDRTSIIASNTFGLIVMWKNQKRDAISVQWAFVASAARL